MFLTFVGRAGEGMADLYEALQPHRGRCHSRTAAAASQQHSSLAAAAEPDELTLAIMGLPNVVRLQTSFSLTC